MTEVQMLRAKAGVDQHKLAGFRIIHRELARRDIQRRHLGRGKIGIRFAVGRVLWATDARSEPDPSLFVDNRIVNGRVTVPNRLVAPVRRVTVGIIER